MCAIFGFLDYGKKISHKTLIMLIRELSVAAESRGTDATGISYVNNGEIVTYKKAKPAHKVKLYFPKDTVAVIGHTRFTTQGSEKHNYNNHPFEGKTDGHSFALGHNGVLWNDQDLRREKNLPDTKIETDSYIAVQLIEQENAVDSSSIKEMAESVTGSFVFTILRDDNTLFLVKVDNPLTIWHYPALGLYVYASTQAILVNAVQAVNILDTPQQLSPDDGNIVEIRPNGNLAVTQFEEAVPTYHRWYSLYDYEEEYTNDLLLICGCYGVSRDDVELLLEWGYTCDEIEEMLMDNVLFEEAISEIKTLYQR